MPEELSRVEAASYLGVSPRTLEYWASKQIGPDYRRRGRRTFYREADLDHWSDIHQLRKMRCEPPAAPIAATTSAQQTPHPMDQNQ